MGNSSYLLLAVDLAMPISLGTFFESGIQFDSHITLLDSKTFMDKEQIFEEAKRLKVVKFLEAAQKSDPIPVEDLFDLDYFPRGYVILRLKEDSSLYRYLKDVHFSLVDKFKPVTEFKKFEAHITLAKGDMPKNIDILERALKDSYVRFEDLLFSYEVDEGDYKVYDLTHYNSVGRYFRIENLRKEIKDLEGED